MLYNDNQFELNSNFHLTIYFAKCLIVSRNHFLPSNYNMVI